LLAQPGAPEAGPAKERALGDALAAEIRKDSRQIGDAQIDALVQRTGRRLAVQSPEFEFRFEVVDTPEATDPIGLPGGAILVPVASLLKADDEAAFARMLAHAMGHVALRHGFSPPASAEAPQIYMDVHPDSRTPALPRAWAERVPRYEAEADRYADALLERAAYDPAAGPAAYRFVQESVRRLQSEPRRRPPSLRRQ
jgi:predicted Zn-dependent protease